MIKVVAHFLDGRLVKGQSFDVSSAKSDCTIHATDGTSVRVTLSELKGLFIVTDFAGKPDYKEVKSATPGDPRGRGARWLELTFLDGEVIVGASTNYSDQSPFFAVVPTDTKSNNTRILVNRAAVGSLRVLPPS